MAIRERLNENLADDLDNQVDDLDKAYIEQLRKSGMDEALIQQFLMMAKTEAHQGDKRDD